VLEGVPWEGRFQVRANVCVVDSLNFTKVLPYLKAARAQVACADGLVVNKTDLLGDTETDRLSLLLRDINARAEQTRVSQGRIEWSFVERLRHARTVGEPIDAPPEEAATYSIPHGRADRDLLFTAIESLGERLLRLKGVVDFGAGPVLVESVFGRVTERPLDAKPARPGTTAVGWGIAKAELRQALEPAFVPATGELIAIREQ
jgi:G3E family GTPase